MGLADWVVVGIGYLFRYRPGGSGDVSAWKGLFPVQRKHGQTAKADAETLTLRDGEGPGQPGHTGWSPGLCREFWLYLSPSFVTVDKSL